MLFFQTYRPPIIIDEIQKALELFEQIKIMCDESEERGLFWLTESQQYRMMKNVRETLAESAEISQPTAKEWLRLLQSLGIIFMLQPYANNALKRLVKTPKLYFCDTGLCAYLSMRLTRDTLMNGAASGHYFENYVIIELLKNYAYSPSKANLTVEKSKNMSFLTR